MRGGGERERERDDVVTFGSLLNYTAVINNTHSPHYLASVLVVLVRKKLGVEVGGLYAMKVLRKSHLVKRRQIERTKTERRVLSMVSHVFIMKLHFAFQSSEKLYLVLDYCPGGELFFHLSRYRRFPERVARFYAAELTEAIGHLHEKGIIYRDLKPENVLLDADGHVKLGDFGLAKDNISHATKGATR